MLGQDGAAREDVEVVEVGVAVDEDDAPAGGEGGGEDLGCAGACSTEGGEG